VQLVREAVESVVLARVVEVEDVLREDADLADARTRGLELGEARDALARRRLLGAAGPGCPCQGRQESEQAMPN